VDRAIRRLPIRDQLRMTLELLGDADEPQPLPANVLRFRPRPT